MFEDKGETARIESCSQLVGFPWLRSGGMWLCCPDRRAFFHRLHLRVYGLLHLQSKNVIFEIC